MQDRLDNTPAPKRQTASFFFYGIFLRRSVRDTYGIRSEPQYATVANYATYGGHIVVADKLEGVTLTGIVVEVPLRAIPQIDALEAAYQRKIVKTQEGQAVFMYVKPTDEYLAERYQLKEVNR